VPTPPSFPISTLRVRPWPDAVIDTVGHDARSAYVERFWLNILGPSSLWLLRRLVNGLDAAPDGYELDLPSCAIELGLGHLSGRSSPFVRSIERCCRFGVCDLQQPDTLLVRRHLPPLTRAQVERLPEGLRTEHQVWVDEPASAPMALDQMRQRARQMALSLLEIGEDGAAAERQLHRWRIHPAVAHEATGWAVARHREAQAAAQRDARRAAGGGTDGPLDAA
jgi:hypothetical protein